MAQCIICRKETKELSEQHVIPEILCGYYFTNSVCDSCHEHLTIHVDRPLIRHKLSQYKIEQMKQQLDSPLYIKEYGQELAAAETDVTETKDEIHYSNSLIMKLCKKHDISLHNEIWKEERVTKVASSIQRELLLDNRKYKMSILKMAYTFAVQTIDGYFYDPDAIEISAILSNADFFELKEKSIVRDLSKSSLWNTLNTKSDNHYFILLSDTDGLFCFVRLFNIFDVVVHLSQKAYHLPSPMIGVNDVQNQSFYIESLKEYMNHLFMEKRPSTHISS
ncbi:HNH endonuclease [Bacillus cytotoxicus]|uniref:Group-specific protein n=2 Tax=Bacillus cytotoxicus TaxID=580165 RepID=A0AAX2CH44_9BACI|nr:MULTISPECIES: HNH endonuclease [Bacillus cereus group]ABS22270.1 group-specific protein [Bacillus cytotoxicus NVH 391-98]AWC32873.1 HNH endonuclease [Bacillus cytotoxicus]AWC36899.1 HNH endonuclease [Bacillus cytotoxicus]AWC44940.1 HNH endonuclease [Bacillus cytotoxicus]AWC61160.1 HNH endonuclease [Bacillus cytotoxicus]